MAISKSLVAHTGGFYLAVSPMYTCTYLGTCSVFIAQIADLVKVRNPSMLLTLVRTHSNSGIAIDASHFPLRKVNFPWRFILGTFCLYFIQRGQNTDSKSWCREAVFEDIGQ